MARGHNRPTFADILHEWEEGLNEWHGDRTYRPALTGSQLARLEGPKMTISETQRMVIRGEKRTRVEEF